MFVEDINRKINGVVKVDEDENKVPGTGTERVRYYTRAEAAFCRLFQYLCRSILTNQRQIQESGSPVFGSGKSHFLKMLSYLLENKEVNGIRTVERFRKKI